MSRATPVLVLRDFHVAFGQKLVLAGVYLTVPPRGVVTILGPGSAGKSTLLRTICGVNVGTAGRAVWGTAHYLDQPFMETAERPLLVQQNARLLIASILDNLLLYLPRDRWTRSEQIAQVAAFLEREGLAELVPRLSEPVNTLPLVEQRLLAILRSLAADPALLCLDEPTAGLTESEAARLLTLLQREAGQRALLLVTHNQQQAQQLGGTVQLLAGGRIVARAAATTFFDDPPNDLARQFVRTGGCAVPSPDADPAMLESDPPTPLVPLPRAVLERVRAAAPELRGFHWLKPGRLAGMPKPGLIRELAGELQSLQQLGVTHVLCLTDDPVPATDLQAFGLIGEVFPIDDMGAPELSEAAQWCAQVHQLLAGNAVIAVHCKAGLGRTGTMLAALLIVEGMSGLQALETVRSAHAHWVQSEAQVDFLIQFDRYFHQTLTPTVAATGDARE